MDHKINPECPRCQGRGIKSSGIFSIPCSSCVAWSDREFCCFCQIKLKADRFLYPDGSFASCVDCFPDLERLYEKRIAESEKRSLMLKNEISIMRQRFLEIRDAERKMSEKMKDDCNVCMGSGRMSYSTEVEGECLYCKKNVLCSKCSALATCEDEDGTRYCGKCGYELYSHELDTYHKDQQEILLIGNKLNALLEESRKRLNRIRALTRLGMNDNKNRSKTSDVVSQTNDVLEAEYLEALRVAFGSRSDVRIWRQLVGNFWTRYGDSDFRPVRTGPPKGAADLSGLVKGSGRRIEIEVKGPKGKLRPEQEQFKKNMEEWGVLYMLCVYDDSMTIEENVMKEVRRFEELLGAIK